MKSRFIFSLTLFYLAGVLFQFVYVPYIARSTQNLMAAYHEAGHAWRWNAPAYYDIEKRVNIYLPDVDEWKANAAEKRKSGSTNNRSLDDLFKEPPKESFPDSWIMIYEIDYKRVMMSFVAWTILLGCIGFAGRNFIKPE